MFSHAGPIHRGFHSFPSHITIFIGPDVALLNGRVSCRVGRDAGAARGVHKQLRRGLRCRVMDGLSSVLASRWFLCRKRCPTWRAMLPCASSQVSMPISVRSQCITRPARCCPLKRASLSISFWRLFGGIAWPSASREVSDGTRPIVLASEPSRQRTHTGRKDLMLGNMASVRPFLVHLGGTSLPEARDSND